MSRRRLRIEKQARQQQILHRYERQRVRNQLAQPGRFPFVLVLDNLKAGYNVAKIFRSALAMGAAGVHLVDIGPFDPAPAKGAFRKVPARFHTNFAAAYQALQHADYHWFAFTPSADITLPESTLPARSAFVFGHEERGLSFSPTDFPAVQSLRIPQAGRVESLNASVAASIAMYEYVCQHGGAKKPGRLRSMLTHLCHPPDKDRHRASNTLGPGCRPTAANPAFHSGAISRCRAFDEVHRDPYHVQSSVPFGMTTG